MQKISSKPGLANFYSQSPPEIKDYFGELPGLLSGGFSFDVLLAYVFARLELAHVNCLYCGVVKLHNVDSGLAMRAIQQFHMTRSGFREKYSVVYGEPISKEVISLHTFAEGVRDAVLHGKQGSDDNKRNAIAHVLEYAKGLNEHTVSLEGPKPFGDLRGFKGARQALSKETSRWVLQGMGFFAQKI